MEIALAHNSSEGRVLGAVRAVLDANGFVPDGDLIRNKTRIERFVFPADAIDARGDRARLIIVGDEALEQDPFNHDWHSETGLGAKSGIENIGPRPIVIRHGCAEIPPFLFPAIVPEDERIAACNVVDFRMSGDSATDRLLEKLGLRVPRDDITMAEALLIQPEWSVGLLYDLAKAGNATTAKALRELDPSLPESVAAALDAITRKDAALLRECLKSDAHNELVIFRLPGGLSLLHIAACIPGSSSLIDLLLDHGLSPNDRSKMGDTPLYHAAWSGEEVTALLLDRGADPANVSLEGNSLLAVAAWLGYAKLAERAMDAGASAFITDKNGGHPLIWASLAGHAEIVKNITNRFPAQIDVSAGEYGLGESDPEFSSEAPNVPAFVRYRRRRIAKGQGLGRTALMVAISASQTAITDLLLALGADPNHGDRQGQRPLHYLSASESDVTEHLFLTLVKAGADVDAVDRDGVTPLSDAVLGDRPDLVRHLLAADANPELKNAEGFSPLHLASSFGKAEIIRLLADKADTEARDSKGFTPLHLGIFFEDVPMEAIQALLENEADPDSKTRDGRRPLSLLLSTERDNATKADIARLLVEHSADPWLPNTDGQVAVLMAALDKFSDFCAPALDKGNSLIASSREASLALVCASAIGRIDIVTSLVRGGTRIDYLAPNGFRALAAASLNGHISVIQLLLNEDALVNPSAGVPTALTCAAEKGYDAIVDLLMERGADPNLPGRGGWTPLFYAVAHGNSHIAKRLLEAGGYLGVRSRSGMTPLHIAARENHEGVAKLLLDLKANIEARDDDGDTPLHFAVMSEHVEVLHLLLDHGACPDTANDKLIRPIHLAAQIGSIDAAQLLHKKGASLEPSNEDNDTPLHIAAANERKDFVGWLLAKGVAPEPRNADGDRPIDLANEIAVQTIFLDRGVEAPRERLQESKRASFLRWNSAESVQRRRVREICSEIAIQRPASGDADSNPFGDVECATLPFYPDCYIAAVSVLGNLPPNQIFFVISENTNQYAALDWTSEPIYRFNEKVGLVLPGDDALKTYIKFLFFFVRGQLGRFIFVEDVADIDWRESASHKIKADVENKLLPLSTIDDAPEGMRRLRFTCIFKNALFQSDVYVALRTMEHHWPEDDDPSQFTIGQSVLRGEKLLEEDLPVIVAGAPGRFG